MNSELSLLGLLFRVVLGVSGGVATAAGLAGIIGILRGKTVLAGAKDFEEFVKWHWNDPDQAAAVLRTRAHLFSVVLVSGLVALSFGIFGRRFEAASLFLWCVSLFVIALWWWLERQFAWPGWLVAREARGTRGLFQARRDDRPQIRQSGDDGEDVGSS
ncbi:hypothetical protein AB1046_18705 [Promicromonospora sp. Populi]|uniref:hypothetical protein n=1 Tax=Promicromonospora sp. Populi TaxID=3239420 RepID=UPI0034E1FD3E